MSDKTEQEETAAPADPELDELLDSALEDFTKKDEVKTQEVVEKKEEDAEWTDEFIKQAAAQFETNMASILGSVSGNDGVEITADQIQQNFQKMAEAAAQVMQNPQTLEPSAQSNDFAATISQTLQNLSLGAETVQNPFSENDIINMFGGAVGGAPDDAGNAFLPFMQGMMQSLLSKDVLYPSLKDILDKYPAWLEENKPPKLDAVQFERYQKQMELMQSVCNELEKETEGDNERVKKQRFDEVLALMQKMQDLGPPPTELVGETGPGLQFDAQGVPMLPSNLGAADPNQCLLM